MIAVLTSGSGSRTDIPARAAKAGHHLVGIYDRGTHDEIVVEKAR